MTPNQRQTKPEDQPAEITVWAPDAGRVEIEVGAPGAERLTVPMTATRAGWWAWRPREHAAHPLDYAFRVDGADWRKAAAAEAARLRREVWAASGW